MFQKSSTKLIIYAIGTFACYFYYGVLQEKITCGLYGEGEKAEKFTHVFALVCFQCVLNYLFAKAILTFVKQGEDSTRTVYYASSALTYLLAMVCSNMSLQFVNYPTQVIAKAGKPIPVMLLGVLLGKKSYPLRKYFFVLLIVSGVAIFMFKDGKTSAQSSSQMGFGEILLLLSLTMDGLLSAVQERMRAEHKTQSLHMMLNMNFWSIIFSGFTIILSGELMRFILFLQKHPNIIVHIINLGATGACGQYFIFLTVAEFGPLPCSIITTTRKFFTVLGSVLLFGNSLLLRQWVATVFVFLGLFLDAMYGKKTAKKETVK
ncbi:solute carrier family 35 member B1 [Leptopilina heterotoma]|uniref:solute carrier family 35 member B1 n=1 Tax=Leptopilina heterotoma TaxID=63436 RepID=UPI001CA9580A|nr:solute carrier family 35 member B1 [Leptopilina heterotoma]